MEITLKLIHGTTFVKTKQKCFNKLIMQLAPSWCATTQNYILKLQFSPPILEKCVHAACNEKKPQEKKRIFYFLCYNVYFFFRVKENSKDSKVSRSTPKAIFLWQIVKIIACKFSNLYVIFFSSFVVESFFFVCNTAAKKNNTKLYVVHWCIVLCILTTGLMKLSP